MQGPKYPDNVSLNKTSSRLPLSYILLYLYDAFEELQTLALMCLVFGVHVGW